jgi:hypothetical protein
LYKPKADFFLQPDYRWSESDHANKLETRA